MKVWVVNASKCTCCDSVVGVFSTEEKANAFESKRTERYTDVYWMILDDEEN